MKAKPDCCLLCGRPGKEHKRGGGGDMVCPEPKEEKAEDSLLQAAQATGRLSIIHIKD